MQAAGPAFLVFQSHAGSIEAGRKQGSAPGEDPFQSHAGSIEADLRDPCQPEEGEFQSHAGSIEADPPVGGGDGRPLVSIPRWFD